MPRVEIFKDRSGGYRWRLRAGNGQIVASGESHTQSSDAKRAWLTVAQITVYDAPQVVNVTRQRRGK